MTTQVTVTKKDDSAHEIEVVLHTHEGESVYGTLKNREDVCLVTVHAAQVVSVREKAPA